MKYLIAIALSMLSFGATAQHRHHGYYHHHHYNNGYNWVLPAVIGGAVVYAATRPAAPPPPPQVIYVPQTLPPAPIGYRYEQILDANCNCYRWVLVQG